MRLVGGVEGEVIAAQRLLHQPAHQVVFARHHELGLGEIAERQRPWPVEGRAGAAHEEQHLPQQRLAVREAVRRGPVGQGHVELAVLDAVDQHMAELLEQLQLQRRLRLRQRAQQTAGQQGRQAGGQAQDDRALHGGITQLAAQLPHPVQDDPRFLQHDVAGRRGGGAPRRPDQERRAQLLLEAPDLQPQSGLGDIERLRRPGDAAGLADLHEIFQLTQAHGRGLPGRSFRGPDGLSQTISV